MSENNIWVDRNLWSALQKMYYWNSKYGTEQYYYNPIVHNAKEPKGSIFDFEKINIIFCESSLVQY